jgi:hypothetical protein
MDVNSILIAFGVLAFFAFILYLGIRSGRADSDNKRQLAQMLGFTIIEPDEGLNEKISNLYQHKSQNKKYQFRHVSCKMLPDGEMLLFDLIETSGEDDSITEQQAVAIISPQLELPGFMLHPKVDAEKYFIGGLANKMIRWATTFVGEPVDFPEFPEFQNKYIVSSLDPEPVRRYFDSSLAQALARTSMYRVYACGDTFTFSQLSTQVKAPNRESLSQRINQALDVYRLLSK